MILYLAADLIWATRIKGVADALGLPCRPARTVEMLDARLADSPVSAVLLDLEKPDEALAMLARLRGPAAGERERAVRVLCWGPHVAKDLLQRARAPGRMRCCPGAPSTTRCRTSCCVWRRARRAYHDRSLDRSRSRA